MKRPVFTTFLKVLFIIIFISFVQEGRCFDAQDSIGGKLGAASTFQGFLENKGQITFTNREPAEEVAYMFRNNNVRVFVLNDGGLAYQINHQEIEEDQQEDDEDDFLFDMLNKAPVATETFRMDLKLVGANPHSEIQTFGKSNDFFHFYTHDALNVHYYQRVVFRDIYPNIDWEIYVNENGVKYDFVVHPGGDPEQIVLEYVYQDSIYLDKDGNLVRLCSLGEFIDKAPVSFQADSPVQSRYVLKENQVRFALDAYNLDQKLTIDPPVIWSTYYGGSEWETSLSTTVDQNQNVYLSGVTNSTNAIAYGGHQNAPHILSDVDAYLVKFDQNGTRLWATYYGGVREDRALACATDNGNNVYLAGYTNSDQNIAFQGHQNSRFNSGVPSYHDAFLVKFDENGVRQWGTYYGGNKDETVTGVCVDLFDNVYLAGATNSFNGISHLGFQNSFGGGSSDAFLVKFNSNGTRIWATYYGGPHNENSSLTTLGNVATDFEGNIFLAGSTLSSTGIAFNGHDNSHNGGVDAFLVKFDSLGQRIWGTYYGGSGGDRGVSCETDNSGNVLLAGITNSQNGIAFQGFQNQLSGNINSYVVKFDALGVRQWGTYFGGNIFERYTGVTTDAFSNIYLSGVTRSDSGIAFNTSFNVKPAASNINDGYIAKFDSNGIGIWARYYGGSNFDTPLCIVTDSSSNVYFCGQTASPGIKTGGHQTVFGGDSDAFLVKLGPGCTRTYDTLSLDFCESISLNGDVFDSTGTYTQVLTNSEGCDSVVVFHLTRYENAFDTIVEAHCEEFTLNGFTYTESGVYDQTFTTASGCDSTLTILLDILQPSYDTIVRSECEYYILNGERYTTSGVYEQYFTNMHGCDSILFLDLTIDFGLCNPYSSSNIYFPNSFTPNNDGLNDFFGPVGDFPGNYEMRIFNRWGQEIYFTNQGVPWDGQFKGTPAPIGTYIYRIIIRLPNNEQVDKTGTLNLLR
jgi:gliding motility-associated-like protein